MTTQSISFDLPSITIKTREDIGKIISEEALEIANEAKILVSQKQENLKEQIKIEIIPKAISMLNCFRDNLTEKRQEIYNSFDPAINQATEALKNLKAKGVPEDDDDYVKVYNNLQDLLEKRKVAVANIEKSLEELEASSKATIDSLTNA
jgi:molecular chaperone DnaK (HSP70)